MGKENLRDIIAQTFVNALSEDKIPWRSMWTASLAENAVNGKRYRGLNSLWLSYIADARGFKDPRWCTFKQAKDKGWNVKKGAKAAWVEFWSVYDVKQRKTISITEANSIVRKDADRKDDMRFVSRQYSVFNAEEIEGIPELEQKHCAVDIDTVRSKRDVLIKNMKLGFYEGGDKAYYSPSTDSITMPPDVCFENTYAYMSTFLHECGHATGSAKRFNRDMTGFFGSESYAKEELRAEIASAFTSQALGFGSEGAELMDAMDNHKAYIQSWIEIIKDKPNELFAAIKDAEAISDYLLEKGEFGIDLGKSFEEEPAKPSLDNLIGSAEAKASLNSPSVHEPVKTTAYTH